MTASSNACKRFYLTKYQACIYCWWWHVSNVTVFPVWKMESLEGFTRTIPHMIYTTYHSKPHPRWLTQPISPWRCCWSSTLSWGWAQSAQTPSSLCDYSSNSRWQVLCYAGGDLWSRASSVRQSVSLERFMHRYRVSSLWETASEGFNNNRGQFAVSSLKKQEAAIHLTHYSCKVHSEILSYPAAKKIYFKGRVQGYI